MKLISHALNEAFSSAIIANLHKNNPDTMNQFFRSLAKFRYSAQGLKDEFITMMTVSDALKKNKSDQILKIWMKGDTIAFFSIANTVIDVNFNWNTKSSPGKRDNNAIIGDTQLVASIMSGAKWDSIGLTDVYAIAISSFKALGEKKQPTEVPTNDDTVIKVTYQPNYKELPKAMKKKPSGIGKRKDTSRKVKVHFCASDIYDFNDPGYEDDVKYYSDECDGFIYDKNGIMHGVKSSSYSSDTGRIAGGTMNYSLTILKANGVDDAHFSGYTAIFSRPSSETCTTIVSDIENGYYLEDYIAKHWLDLSYSTRDKFKAQFEKGDPNALSYTGIKKSIADIKKENFWARYLYMPRAFSFSIEKEGVKLSNVLGYDKELSRFNNLSRDEWEKIKDERAKIVEKKTEVLVKGIITPIIIRELKKLFKTGTISNYAGISGYIGFKEISYDIKPAFDSVEQKFVLVNPDNQSINSSSPEMILDGQLTFYKDKASNASAKLFKAASEAFLKANKKKQTEYVNANWESIYDKSFAYWKYTKTKSQARAEAKQDFINMLNKNDYAKSNVLYFAWPMLKDFIEKDASYVDPDVQNTSVTPQAPLSVNVENVDNILSKVKPSFYKEAYRKMADWYNGIRTENVRALGDEKLKIYYAICLKSGFTQNAEKLKQEALSRNILFESNKPKSLSSILNECFK